MTSNAGTAQPAYKSQPHLHEPRLVLSSHHRGPGILDRIAAWVNEFVGSMWVFVGVSIFIVVWLFAGNIVGFDKTPWPLLLTLLNLPQLSIMISLQVSANLAQRTSDARAIADHETLIALHELSKQQLAILDGQNRVLDLLQAAAQVTRPGAALAGASGQQPVAGSSPAGTSAEQGPLAEDGQPR